MILANHINIYNHTILFIYVNRDQFTDIQKEWPNFELTLSITLLIIIIVYLNFINDVGIKRKWKNNKMTRGNKIILKYYGNYMCQNQGESDMWQKGFYLLG